MRPWGRALGIAIGVAALAAVGLSTCGPKASSSALDVILRVPPGVDASYFQLAAWSQPSQTATTACFRNSGGSDTPVAVYEGGPLGSNIELLAQGYADSNCSALTASSAPPTAATFSSGSTPVVLVLAPPVLGADAGPDAGPRPDAGGDGGPPPADAGMDAGEDAGTSGDGGPADSGSALDSGSDAGPAPSDAGQLDAGPVDSGAPDSGSVDAGGGTQDSGPQDAGPADAGPGRDAGSGGQDAGPPAFGYPPSNFNPGEIASVGGRLVINCTQLVDTTNVTTAVTLCGQTLATTLVPQGNGPAAVVLGVAGLVVDAGAGLSFAGSKPFIFAVFGDATVAGYLRATAFGPDAGPGADGPWCQAATSGAVNASASGSGGGGNGFAGGAGGKDGPGDSPGNGGTSFAFQSIIPLQGGCSGAAGAAPSGNALALRGGAGGALQISAAGALHVNAGGYLAASGAGGAA